ncbi:hypothetical protein AMJ80_08585 [bacterium SM23_31]|nr:MAG: hypothetical protein AMJ80_08585 [bacterium SM23_31]
MNSSSLNYSIQRKHIYFCLVSMLIVLFFNNCSNILNEDQGFYRIPEPAFSSFDKKPSWSPDGQKIIFKRWFIVNIDRDKGSDIDVDSTGFWTMDIDNGNMKFLAQGVALNSPDYSPDGYWIVFDYAGIIYKAPVIGDSLDLANRIKLTKSGSDHSPEWSTDGEWIVYKKSTGSTMGVWIIKQDGSERKHIFNYGRSSPTWHTNSMNIFTFAGPFLDDYMLKFYPFTEATPDTIESIKNSDNRYPKISPDGRSVAFSSSEEGKKRYIWTMNIDGADKRRLTNGDQPAWSPDGTKIAFMWYSQAGGLGTIWVMNSNGENTRQLTFLPQNVLDSLAVFGYDIRR